MSASRGVAVLARPSGGATGWGIGLCVLSAGMWATGSVLSRRLPLPADPFLATSYEMLSGGLVMLPFGIATMGTFAPSTESVLGWVYLVTIGSVVGYTAYVWLLANAPLSLVSTYAFMNPLVAISLGVLFQGEHLGVRLLVGAAIVVVGRGDRRHAGAAGRDPARGGSALVVDDVVGPDRDARQRPARRGSQRRDDRGGRDDGRRLADTLDAVRARRARGPRSARSRPAACRARSGSGSP